MFIILRWVGEWAICSYQIDGISAGPFTLRSAAEKAIEEYYRCWPDDYPGVKFHILECSFPGPPES